MRCKESWRHWPRAALERWWMKRVRLRHTRQPYLVPLTPIPCRNLFLGIVSPCCIAQDRVHSDEFDYRTGSKGPGDQCVRTREDVCWDGWISPQGRQSYRVCCGGIGGDSTLGESRIGCLGVRLLRIAVTVVGWWQFSCCEK